MLVLPMLTGMFLLISSPKTASAIVCPNGETLPDAEAANCPPANNANGSGTTDEPQFVKTDCDGANIASGLPEDDENHCGILDYLVLAINLLSALVGVVVVGSIIYGGIQYSMAGSDPQKVAAAKERIRNALIALVFFIFAYSFLNYLVPGGLLI